MHTKKATVETSWVMFAAVIVIGVSVLTAISAKQYLGSTELKKEVDRLSFFERAKSIINTLDSAEAGEVTEILVEPATVELVKTGAGNMLKVEKKEGKITSDIKEGKVTSNKIKFLKTAGKPIEIAYG